MARGLVLWGINNIYSVQDESDGILYECRIKGKVLDRDRTEYNPLAPGDRVSFNPGETGSGRGSIETRLERTNALVRRNLKKKRPQTIAANVDMIFCLTSPEMPPFRPRFIDRVCIAGEMENIPVSVIVNKDDQKISAEMKTRLGVFRNLGHGLYRCSALRDGKFREIEDALRGKTSVFFGQSGVGKSTLINRLLPGAGQKTDEVSEKYNRGRHTTNYAVYLPLPGGGGIIDTPGVRDFAVTGLDPAQLGSYFHDFDPYRKYCDFTSCRHDREPRCGIRDAVDNGDIHPDRYESYIRLYDELNNSR
jgi:ribosome biogenesis GTPase